jgi:uncharacterized membrane protein YphA (DoxX/SURF4 family)
MVWFHGRGKLLNFESMHTQFPDPLGVGSTTSLVLALFGEVLFPAFLAFGLLTRLSALISAFTMGVAFFVIHGGALSGQNSGEMSYLYPRRFLRTAPRRGAGATRSIASWARRVKAACASAPVGQKPI